jgi:isoleucyl-tRNA synthetase
VVELALEEVEIAAEDIPGWSVASKNGLTVALDITLTDELKEEGDARELVNRIQNIRKDNAFEVTDRIDVQWTGPENLKISVDNFKTYICAEILADSLNWVPTLDTGIEIEVNEANLKVHVSKKEN